jgi:hypothetical protein
MGEEFTAEEFAELLAEALKGMAVGYLLILLVMCHAKTFAERVLAVLRNMKRLKKLSAAVVAALRRVAFLTGTCGDEQLVTAAASPTAAGKLVFPGTGVITGIRRGMMLAHPAVLTLGEMLRVLPSSVNMEVLAFDAAARREFLAQPAHNYFVMSGDQVAMFEFPESQPFVTGETVARPFLPDQLPEHSLAPTPAELTALAQLKEADADAIENEISDGSEAIATSKAVSVFALAAAKVGVGAKESFAYVKGGCGPSSAFDCSLTIAALKSFRLLGVARVVNAAGALAEEKTDSAVALAIGEAAAFHGLRSS